MIICKMTEEQFELLAEAFWEYSIHFPKTRNPYYPIVRDLSTLLKNITLDYDEVGEYSRKLLELDLTV